ncbi:MAG: hypothetical protein JW832_08715 [Deltaproteobacteria bacterium]|nr:hypothetical protein [Deltaproteobacteria bacterium]
MRTGVIVVLAVVQIFVFGLRAGAQEPRINVKSLQGLTGLAVIVGKLSEDAKKIPITNNDIQEIAELKLRMAGIKVLSKEDRLRTPGMPYLYVRLSVKATDDGFIYGSTKIQIKEEACLSRKELCGAFITWDNGSIFSVGMDRAKQFVQDSINEDMDIFLSDYYTVNPRTEAATSLPQKTK